MEQLLHYVWKHRLYPLTGLVTVDGQRVEVLDPGLNNIHAGPDFSEAKVIIGDTTWAGNVELHLKASDWYLHHHESDGRYDNIILHVVTDSDTLICRNDGSPIPQVVLPIPPSVTENYRALLSADRYPPCYHVVGDLSRFMVHSWLSALLCERLELRTTQIQQRYEQHELNWDDALFSTLARGFGFGVNGDAFDAWARSIPFRAVDHHRDNLLQVEAIFFGQAGLLDENAQPQSHREAALAEPYYQQLRREYAFLAHKFSLTPISYTLWKFARMRPDGSPFVRMAQLAKLYHQASVTVSKLRDAADREAISAMLRVTASSYWDTHFSFGSDATTLRPKALGESSIRLLLINVMLPFLFACSRHRQDEQGAERAIAIFESLPAEDNHITRDWSGCGLNVDNAADSQALIHLKNRYCNTHDCLRCRIGYEYLKRS